MQWCSKQLHVFLSMFNERISLLLLLFSSYPCGPVCVCVCVWGLWAQSPTLVVARPVGRNRSAARPQLLSLAQWRTDHIHTRSAMDTGYARRLRQRHELRECSMCSDVTHVYIWSKYTSYFSHYTHFHCGSRIKAVLSMNLQACRKTFTEVGSNKVHIFHYSA